MQQEPEAKEPAVPESEVKRIVAQVPGAEYALRALIVSRDERIWDFKRIDDRIASLPQDSVYPEKTAIRQEMISVIHEWKSRDPGEFHTAEGLFALWLKLLQIRDRFPFGSLANDAGHAYCFYVGMGIGETLPEGLWRTMQAVESAPKSIKLIEDQLAKNPDARIGVTLHDLRFRSDLSYLLGLENPQVFDRYLVAVGATHLRARLARYAAMSWKSRLWVWFRNSDLFDRWDAR